MLQVPEAVQEAAESFLSLSSSSSSSSSSSPHLTSPQFLQGLISAAHAAMPASSPLLPPCHRPKPGSLDDLGVRRCVMDGIARLVAVVRPASVAVPLAAGLTGPVINLALQCAAVQPSSEGEAKRLASELITQFSLLSSIIQNLRSTPGYPSRQQSRQPGRVAAKQAPPPSSADGLAEQEQRQVFLSTIEACAPVTQQVLTSEGLCSLPGVVAAVAQVYMNCLVLLRLPQPPFLPPVALLFAFFRVHRDPVCLDVAALAVELTGGVNGDFEPCSQILQVATETVFQVIQVRECCYSRFLCA